MFAKKSLKYQTLKCSFKAILGINYDYYNFYLRKKLITWSLRILENSVNSNA